MSSVLFFDAIFPSNTPCVQVQPTTLSYTIEGKRSLAVDCCKVIDCLGITQIEKNDVIISVNGQPLINQQLPIGISYFDHVQNVLSNTALRRTVRFMRCVSGSMDTAVNAIIVRVSPEEAALFFDAGDNSDNSQGWILHGSTSITDSLTPPPPPVQETTAKVFPGASNRVEEERVYSYHPEINDNKVRDVSSKNRWTEEMYLSEEMDQHMIEQNEKRHEHRSQSSTTSSSSSSSTGSYHHKHRRNQFQQEEEDRGDYRHRVSTVEQERNEIRRLMEDEYNRRLEDERWELQRLQEQRRAEEEELRRCRAEEEELRLNREQEMLEYHRRSLTIAPVLSAAKTGLSAPGHHLPYLNDPYRMTQTAHQQTSDHIENLVQQRVAAEIEQRLRVELELSKATAELELAKATAARTAAMTQSGESIDAMVSKRLSAMETKMKQEIEAAKKQAFAVAHNEATRLLQERTEQERQQQAEEQRRESMLHDQRERQRIIAEAMLMQEKVLHADMESRRVSEALHLQDERNLVEKERKRVENEKRCIEEEKRLAALEIEQRASMARAELEAGRERMAKEAERREAGLAVFAARAEQARAMEARAADEVRIAEQLRDTLMRSSLLRSKGIEGGLESVGSTTAAITVPTAVSSSYSGSDHSLHYKNEKTMVAIVEQNSTVNNHHKRQQDEVENQRTIQLEQERLMLLTELTNTQRREFEKQRLLEEENIRLRLEQERLAAIAQKREIEDKEHAAQLAAEEERLRAVRMQLEIQRRVDAEKAMLQQQRELEEERQKLLETERQLMRRLEEEERIFQVNRQQRIDEEVRRRVEEKSRRLLDHEKSSNNQYEDVQDNDDDEYMDLTHNFTNYEQELIPTVATARLMEETRNLDDQLNQAKEKAMVIRLEIEKLKLQRQHDYQTNVNDVIEKTMVEEETLRVLKKKHIEDRATAILMDEIRQLGGHSMTMSIESKYERETTNNFMDATELDDDLSQSLDDRKSMGSRNISSSIPPKLSPSSLDTKDIFEVMVVPPAPLIPSRPIPPRPLPTSIDHKKMMEHHHVWINKCDIGNHSVDTMDSGSDNKTIPSVPFLSNSVRHQNTSGPITNSMNTSSSSSSSYAFRAIPPPMPPPDESYPNDPFDIQIPPAPAVPHRPLPTSISPPVGVSTQNNHIPTVSHHPYKEEEEEEDHPQNLVLIPLGSTPRKSTDDQ